MLQWRGGVYELFEYIPGQGYPQTLEATFDSGRVLALYHKLLLRFHDRMATAQRQLSHGPVGGAGPAADPAASCSRPWAIDRSSSRCSTFCMESYRHAAEMVEHWAWTWPKQIVHADWHPGNMLFRDNHVVAVIDYDSARLLPRIIDIANGALQFSIIGGDEDVSKWPDYIDESRFKRFLRGYDEVMLLSARRRFAPIPWLMIEALIAEAVFPIAATGNFRPDGRAGVSADGAAKGLLDEQQAADG